MYDELIKNLRTCSRCDFGQDCNSCTQKSEDEFCCDILLHKAADAIEGLSEFVNNISKLPDCNSCMKKNTCEYVPRYGQHCRINCAFWVGQPRIHVEGE